MVVGNLITAAARSAGSASSKPRRHENEVGVPTWKRKSSGA